MDRPENVINMGEFGIMRGWKRADNTSPHPLNHPTVRAVEVSLESITVTPELIERFWSKVDRSTNNDSCWQWTGQRSVRGGYGALKFKGNLFKAHRVSFQIANGEIPDGFDIHHACGIKSCVNPAHLVALPHGAHSALRAGGRFPRKLTHCKNGHEFTSANTYVWRHMRRCRTCQASQAARKRERRSNAHAS
jgi:hypothetical protein